MICEKDINKILQKFPSFELCYENISHNKVYNSNVCLAIPKGKKCFAWFTVYNKDNVCFLLEINENKNIIDLQIINVIFSDNLSSGTILYGTSFNNNYFCIEDIYYYAGKSLINNSFDYKLKKLKHFFENDILQTNLDNKSTIFGLPYLTNDLNYLLKHIHTLTYDICCIQFRYFNSSKISIYKLTKNNKTSIFKITADIEPDIYKVFSVKNNIDTLVGTACIPDYKTSVFMNSLFRNIKENKNLDFIEESDSDSDFEDCREDKYVYLDKSFNMLCEYNNKFKSWTPIKICE